MLAQLLLTIALAGLLAYILVCEWIAVPDAKAKAPEGRWATAQRADVLLGASFLLGLALIWLP